MSWDAILNVALGVIGISLFGVSKLARQILIEAIRHPFRTTTIEGEQSQSAVAQSHT